MKKLLIPVFFLLSVSLLLLLYQWSSLDQEKDSRAFSDEEDLRAHILLSIRNDRVGIEYTFDAMAPGVYKIHVPDGAGEVGCTYETKKECRLSDSEDYQQLNVESSQILKLSYEMAMPKDLLLYDWNIHVTKKGKVIDPTYEVKVEDHQYTDGSWIGLSAKVSDIQKDFVRVHQFEQTSLEEYPLRLVPDDKSVWEYGGWRITHFSDHPLTEDFKQQFINMAKLYEPAIVELDSSEKQWKDGYLSISGRNIKSVEKTLFEHQLSKGDGKEKSVVSVLSALYFPERSKGEEGAKPLVRSLRETFSEEEREKIKQSLLKEQGSQPLPVRLDEVISEVSGKDTQYFQKNEGAEVDRPFFLTIPKKVHFNQSQMSWKGIEYGGGLYFPLEDLADAAGYTLTPLDEEAAFRLTLPNVEYRFYVNQATFIMNQQEFGVAQDVLKKVNGKVYINAKHIEDLLKLTMIETEEEIRLQKK